jgi:hypothetical protein
MSVRLVVNAAPGKGSELARVRGRGLEKAATVQGASRVLMTVRNPLEVGRFQARN